MADSGWAEQSFASTRWSLIARAADADIHIRREAIEQLVTRYYAPMRTHLLRQRLPSDLVDDHLQNFVLGKFLDGFFERSWNKSQRFRSFLKVCLNNFVTDALRHVRSDSNKPNAGPSTDASGISEPSTGPTESSFDLEWARCVLQQGLDRMHAECLNSGVEDRWLIFRERFLRPTLAGSTPVAYSLLVESHDLKSQREAENILVNEKRHFGRALSAVIAEYAGSPEQAEEELLDLRRILATSQELGIQIPGDTGLPSSIRDNTASVLFEEGFSGIDEAKRQTIQQELATLLQMTIDRLPGQPPLSGGEWRSLTVDQIFRAKTPPAAALNRIRRFAKPVIRESGSPVYILLYHTAIAAAIVRTAEQISQLRNADLLTAVKTHLADNWYGEPIFSVLLEAQQQLTGTDAKLPDP